MRSGLTTLHSRRQALTKSLFDNIVSNNAHKLHKLLPAYQRIITQKEKVKKFYDKTCKCKLADSNKPCSTTLTLDDFIDCRNNCSELSLSELDLDILGDIQSSLRCCNTKLP